MEKKSTSNSSLAELLKGESTGGILLVICAIIAIIIANSPLVHLYDAVIATKVNVSVGDFKIDNRCCYGSTMA